MKFLWCYLYFFGTIKALFTDSRLIWTSNRYWQFALSLGKERPYEFSKFNPLNRDTPLVRKL